MPIPDIISNLSTAQFRQYVLETLESIAGTTGQVAGFSNLSTAKFRQYMLGLLVEIAQNGGGGGGAPSGPAGGDLSATYPNPTVSKLLGRALAVATPTNGQVLAWNATSSSWTPTSVSGAGTVTSITAGAGLSGGTITGSGTIALTTTGVSALPYGSATQVPAFVVDIYGRITSVTNQAITPAGIGAQAALTTAAPLALSLGGTGSTTATSALSNLGGITSAALNGYAVTSQLAAFQNSAQVQALASAQISAITPASIGAVATSSIIGISKGGTGATDAVSALSALGGITSAAISGLASTSQLSGFATTSQISGFTNTAQVSAIASAQIAAITPASIGAVSTSAVIAISKGGTGATDAPSALSNLGGITSAALSGYATTSQTGGLTSAQVEGLVTEQISALGTGLGAGQKWDATKTYKAGDVVTLENSSQAYVSLTDGNIGAAPYLGAPWQVLDANAFSLRGYGLSNSTPQSGQVLTFQSGYDIWVPQNVTITSAQLPSNTLQAIGGAPLVDPYFTGYGPQGPTKGFGTNNNYLATTEFVRQNSSLFKFSPIGQTQEISVGTKYILASDLSFIPRQAVLLFGDSSNYMIGSITSYNGGLLVIEVTEAVGSGNFDVTITVSPVSGAGSGALLAANNLNDVADATASLSNLGGVPASRSITGVGALTGGGDLSTNRTLNLSEFTMSPYQVGSSAEIPVLTVDPYGRISAKTTAAVDASLLKGNPISSTAPASGEALIWNGTSWAPTATSGTGTVSSVGLDTTGTGLTTSGTNPITSSGTITIGGTLNVASGGTGATDAVSALTNLGGITTVALSGLATTAQIAAITPSTIGAVATSDIIAISNGGTGSTSAVAALTALGAMSATQAAGGDLTGSLPSPTVSKIQGQAVSASTPINGQVLTWNGSAWVATAPATGGSGGGGVLFYLNYGTASIAPSPAGTKELGRTAEVAQTTVTSGILTAGVWTPVAGFVSNLSDPNLEFLPGGIFDFNIWCRSDANVAAPTSLRVLVNKWDGTASTLIATSGTAVVSNNGTSVQTAISLVIPQTDIALTDRLYIVIEAIATGNGHTVTVDFGDSTPSHVHTTIPSVGGTGVVKVINGVPQNPASLITDSDVSAAAPLALNKIQMGQVSVATGAGLTGGDDLSASRTLSIAALSPNPAGTFGSSAQLASLTVNNLGQVTSASAVTFANVNIQAFASSANWSKPLNAKRVKVELIGGGGGGGGGAVSIGSFITCGGGGGGSGGLTILDLPADSLPASVLVTIGSGGGGGSGAIFASSSSNGGNGGVGTFTSFGVFAYAQGGGFGYGGLSGALTGSPTGLAGTGSTGGNNGSAASITGTNGVTGVPGTANVASTIGSGGGGSGGGVTAGAVSSNGGAGGRINILNQAGGTAGTAGGSGGAGPTTTANGPTGGIVRGGGGGAGASVATATSFTASGSGGAGGAAGGGGGGGGAILATGSITVSSGSGGNGGAGYAIITTYFY